MNLQDFEEKFGTQEQCLDYLVSFRWPNGACCKHPECQKYAKRNNKRYNQYKFRCRRCLAQYSVIKETLFQGTKHKLIPLWFRAIWYITSQSCGTSALGLQRFLCLGSYRTAWTWLQKLRQVMISEYDKLRGTVIVDQFFIKVKPRENSGGYIDSDYREDKFPVLIAIEFNDKKIGKIRMKNIECDDTYDVANFIKNSVEPSNNTILSNKNINFSKVPQPQYPLKLVKKEPDKNYPPVHKVILSLEKEKLLDSLACKLSDINLDNYLNECCFKFNRRKNKNRCFDDLLQNAINTAPNQIVKN